MDQMNRLRQVTSQRREVEEQASLRSFQEASKKRLLRILEKKLHTSFIGALSHFETHFGRLWGHGKDEMDCTAEELAWREVWNLCRTDVLNNGNNQVRAVIAELALYVVSFNRYQVKLPSAEALDVANQERKS